MRHHTCNRALWKLQFWYEYFMQTNVYNELTKVATSLSFLFLVFSGSWVCLQLVFMRHSKQDHFRWSTKCSIDIFASDGNLFEHVFICTSFNCSINVIQTLYAHKLAISVEPQRSSEYLSPMPMSQMNWRDP